MRQYPAFTFRGVTPKDGKAKLPGPGAYEPPRPDVVSMRARCVAWRIVSFHEGVALMPER